jgi:sarcosine oxidase subunit beta
MTRESDAIVVGGGIHGLSAALHLARMGKSVTVLERRYSGRHSSGVNAGGVRTLGRDLAEVPLSVPGMALWHGIRELVGEDCGFRAQGFVRVAENIEQADSLVGRRDRVRAIGYTHEEVIDQGELRRVLPAVAKHCVAGLICRSDGAADPFRTTLAFKRAAIEAGAMVIEDEGVVAITAQDRHWCVTGTRGTYRAGHVVNCAGAWGGEIARMVGDAAPVGVRPSMMIVTERVPHFVDPTVGAVGRKLSFKQTPEGTVLIGGGQPGIADRATERARVNPLNLAKSAQAAIALFPVMRGVGIARAWCGIEAQMPDDIPVIGESPSAPGIVHAFGFSGHGFQLGPIVGRAVAEIVARGATSLPIGPFAIERFALGKSGTREGQRGHEIIRPAAPR